MISSGNYQQAFSECQVKRMLNDLATAKSCDYLAQIGGVPPPNAFITQTAEDRVNETGYCLEQLVLSASYNDAGHNFRLFEDNSDTGMEVYSTGWVNGPATNFSYSTNWSGIAGAKQLKLNTQYEAVLTVRNSVGEEHTTDYTFMTPKTNCVPVGQIDPPQALTISPNPTGNGVVRIDFTGRQGVVLDLWATHYVTGTMNQLKSDYIATEGGNTFSVDVSQLAPGPYTFSLVGNTYFYQGNLIKQ